MFDPPLSLKIFWNILFYSAKYLKIARHTNTVQIHEE